MNQILITGQILKLALAQPHELSKSWEKSLAGRIKIGSKSSNETLAEVYGERANFLFAVLEHRKWMQHIGRDELQTLFLGGAYRVQLDYWTSSAPILPRIALFEAVLSGLVTNEAQARDFYTARGLQPIEADVLAVEGLVEMIAFLQAVDVSDQKLLIQSTHAEYRAMKREAAEKVDAVITATETVH